MQGTARGGAARAELVQLVARAKSEKRQLGRAQDRGLETHATRLRPAQGAVSHAASPAAIPRLDFSLSDSEKQAVRPLTMRPKTAPAADTENLYRISGAVLHAAAPNVTAGCWPR